MKITKLILFLVLSNFSLSHAADNNLLNQVSFQASATEKVANDQMVAILQIQANGADPAVLANQVNKQMAQVLKQTDRYPAIEHQTLNYNTRPIYRDRTITSWQVTQSLKLTSKQFGQLSELIAKVNRQTTVQSIQFQISAATIEQKQQALTKKAIAKFRRQAELITQQFGKRSYHLVHVNIGNNHVVPQHRAMRSMAMESMDTAPALSAGTNNLTINVNGTIELL